jgi:hypothetical protein
MAPEQARSIFIPSIHRSVDDARMRALMDNLKFYDIDRIDFFEINPPLKRWRRAAVYFKVAGWGGVEECLGAWEEPNEVFVTYTAADDGKEYKSTVTYNNTPVPETEQNIHQIAFSVKQHSEHLAGTTEWFYWLVEENRKNQERILMLEQRLAERSGMVTPPPSRSADIDFKGVEPPLLIRRKARDYRININDRLCVCDYEEGEVVEEADEFSL